MPFLRGQVSFARYNPGTGPAMIGETELERLQDNALRPVEIGEPPEIESGWVTGRHVYDTAFDHAKCIMDSGAIAHFGLRIDTNRVPGEIKRAIRAEHEAALLADAAAEGFAGLGRNGKRELKELVDAALRNELVSGKHRKSKMIPMLWAPSRGCLLAASGSGTVDEVLRERWRHTFERPLEAAGAGRLAYELMLDRGRTREYEDATPTSFMPPPSTFVPRADEEGGAWAISTTTPPVPWALAGPEPRDFLGNEFLLWLWWCTESSRGAVDLKDGTNGAATVQLVIDGAIEMRCPWGTTGAATFKSETGELAPIQTTEVAEALAVGKWPRKMGITIAEDDDVWRLTLQGDRWLVSGCALPETDEEFDTPRDAEEYRVEKIMRIDALLVALYTKFLMTRTDAGWSNTADQMRTWIKAKQRPAGSKPAPMPMIEPKVESVPAAIAPMPESTPESMPAPDPDEPVIDEVPAQSPQPM